MSFTGFLCAFGLGILVGAVGGIVLGFAWYERKCGLLTDERGKRATIRAELDDVMDRLAEKRRSTIDGEPKPRFSPNAGVRKIRRWKSRLPLFSLVALKGRRAVNNRPFLGLCAVIRMSRPA
jgi:hypothetical protein